MERFVRDGRFVGRVRSGRPDQVQQVGEAGIVWRVTLLQPLDQQCL